LAFPITRNNFFLLFSAFPIIRSIQLSFYEASIISQKFIGLENYIDIFNSPRILNAFANSGKFTLLIVPIVTFLPLIIAAIGYRMHKTLQTAIRFAYYIPVISAGPIVTMYLALAIKSIWPYQSIIRKADILVRI